MTELIHQTNYAKLVSAAPVMSNDPAAYRLARRNGELILQGAYRWQQGSMGGHEWRDIPIVELDEPEPKPEEPPPDRIRPGDVWEFETDVLVKGSRKISPTKRELFKLLLQSGGATRCVSIEWLEPFANAVLERWGND